MSSRRLPRESPSVSGDTHTQAPDVTYGGRSHVESPGGRVSSTLPTVPVKRFGRTKIRHGSALTRELASPRPLSFLDFLSEHAELGVTVPNKNFHTVPEAVPGSLPLARTPHIALGTMQSGCNGSDGRLPAKLGGAGCATPTELLSTVKALLPKDSSSGCVGQSPVGRKASLKSSMI